MNNVQIELARDQRRQGQSLTLSQYVHLRNGVPLGDSKSLRNMLYRSFGAASFATFWQYWNPIWSYGLGNYVYSPLRQILPPFAALILTFVISGGIHDLVIMAINRSITFFLPPGFSCLVLGPCWAGHLIWIYRTMPGGVGQPSILPTWFLV
jgi:hypothetical protein